MSNNPFIHNIHKNTAAIFSKKAKEYDSSLYIIAERTVDSAINALKKFGDGYIVDYGDVRYLLRVSVDDQGNSVSWIEYASDDEGIRRYESTGPDAHLLASSFATFHPNACFMYAKRDGSGVPYPILLYGAEKHETCCHLSTNSLKKFIDNNITNFTIACTQSVRTQTCTDTNKV